MANIAAERQFAKFVAETALVNYRRCCCCQRDGSLRFDSMMQSMMLLQQKLHRNAALCVQLQVKLKLLLLMVMKSVDDADAASQVQLLLTLRAGR